MRCPVVANASRPEARLGRVPGFLPPNAPRFCFATVRSSLAGGAASAHQVLLNTQVDNLVGSEGQVGTKRGVAASYTAAKHGRFV